MSSTTRQTPVAQTRGTSAKKTVAAKPAVSRSTDKPVARTEASPLRPAAAVTTTADDGGSSATWFGLFALLGVSLIGAFAVLIARRVKRAAVPAVPVMTPAEAKDAAMEAELQAMIAETEARTSHAPDDLEDARNRHRFTITG